MAESDDAYYVERIRRGVDFIEAHLEEEVPLGAVAKAAGLSQWHFQRIFKSLTGETLKTYIRSRRMANALERLAGTDLRVLDIALDAGFESQEAFARAFKKAFGMTPTAYRGLGKRNLFPRKLQLDEDSIAYLRDRVSREPVIETRDAMCLVGLQTTFYGVDSEKNDLGDKLPRLWDEFLPWLDRIEKAIPGVCYGVIRPGLVEDGEALDYHAAIEVHPNAPVPDGLVRLELPGATYARFAHRGPAREVDHTVSYAYSTWLMAGDYRHSYGADLEIYGEGYDAESHESELFYAIPVVS